MNQLEIAIETAKGDWYEFCVEKSFKYRDGSLMHVLWWSLQYELCDDETIHQWATNPEQALQDWYEYFMYKWEQHNPKITPFYKKRTS